MRECGGRQVPAVPTHAPASPRKRAVPQYAKLSSKFKLPQHPVYRRAASNISTDEQEFEMYKNAPLSREDTDLVNFWDVCVIFLIHFLNFYQLCSKG